MQRIPYVCPETRESLRITGDGLVREDGGVYPYLPGGAEFAAPVPNFLNLAIAGAGQRVSLDMYNTESASAFYRMSRGSGTHSSNGCVSRRGNARS